MSGNQMPHVKHTVVTPVDPQGTAHHQRVQAIIDAPHNASRHTSETPPNSPAPPPLPLGHPLAQGPKNANAMRLLREK